MYQWVRANVVIRFAHAQQQQSRPQCPQWADYRSVAKYGSYISTVAALHCSFQLPFQECMESLAYIGSHPAFLASPSTCRLMPFLICSRLHCFPHALHFDFVRREQREDFGYYVMQWH